MSETGADANLLMEFVGWVLRTTAYSLLAVFGSEAAIRRYLAWRERRGGRGVCSLLGMGGGGPERRGWRGLARAVGSLWR